MRSDPFSSAPDDGDPGGPPTLVERLTLQFYDWERRGRGWEVHAHPVDLEPPFTPFWFHGTPPQPGRDDGRRPTLGSAFLDGLRRFFGGERRWTEAPLELGDAGDLDPDPAPYTASLVELRLTVPPAFKVAQEPVEQLLSALPGVGAPIAFEVVGSSESIVVQLTVPEADADRVTTLLRAYFPEVIVTREGPDLVARWQVPQERAGAVADFGLSHECILPLRAYRTYDPDPLIGVAAALTDLREGETGLLQVLFQPVRHPWAESMLRAAQDGSGGSFFADAPEFPKLTREKVAHPLFAAVVRAGASAQSPDRAWTIAEGIGAALRALTNPAGNALVALANDDYDDAEHEADLLRRRSRRCGMLLNAHEILNLVHPPSASVRMEKLRRETRTTKAAPAAATGHSYVLGENVHAGVRVPVGLSPEDRSRHLYLVGASGTGKSTLLLNLILQDLESGHGIAVLDPHGDLVDQVAARVPERRLDDVTLFDPADAEWPIGFNILSAHSDLEKTLLASDLVAVFRRLATSWGDQMTSVLGNAILAMLESDRGGTLADLRRFLVEAAFRREWLASVRDPAVAYYWQQEFPLLAGKPQAPLLTRLDTFLRPRLIRNIVGQRENRLDFATMMQQGKIFLAKLAQGAIGEENAHLLGSLLVGKIQETAMSRQALPESARRPFTLYVDEFHHFVTPSMTQILSGARKYGLGLVLAHQDLRQISSRDPEVLSSVLANAATRICFRVGDQDARALEEGFATFDRSDLQRLGTGQAIVRLGRADWDCNLDTALVPQLDPEQASTRREEVVARSRRRHGRRREEVDDLLAETMPGRRDEPETTPPTAPAPHSLAPVPNRPPPSTSRVESPRRGAPPQKSEAASAPSPGRGGPQHKYLQELLRKWAEAHGWGATVEEKVLDGAGIVDVALRKGGRSVACEITSTTTAEHEIGNIQKCLAAGFDTVILIPTDKRAVKRLQKAVVKGLGKEAVGQVHVAGTGEAIGILSKLGEGPLVTESTVRGYRVRAKVGRSVESPAGRPAQVVSQVIAKTLRRIKGQQ